MGAAARKTRAARETAEERRKTGAATESESESESETIGAEESGLDGLDGLDGHGGPKKKKKTGGARESESGLALQQMRGPGEYR